MARFDAVVFDWYATLAAPEGSDWWKTMFQLLDEAGAVLPDDALEAWVNPPTDHRSASVDEDAYRAYEQRQLERLLAASGLDQSVQRELAEVLLPLRDREEVGIFPDVAAFLAELRSEGIVVALCSNWSWDLERHLDAAGITELFDAIVCSAMVGYRKPHPAIFEVLRGRLEVPPERTAFVGDDWNADVEGAMAAGMTPFHLARSACSIETHGAVPCASDLAALRPHLLGSPAPHGS